MLTVTFTFTDEEVDRLEAAGVTPDEFFRFAIGLLPEKPEQEVEPAESQPQGKRYNWQNGAFRCPEEPHPATTLEVIIAPAR